MHTFIHRNYVSENGITLVLSSIRTLVQLSLCGTLMYIILYIMIFYCELLHNLFYGPQ